MMIVTPIEGFCNCSMFCCALLYAHSSFAIILTGRRELVALLYLSSWCPVIVVSFFLVMSHVCLQFVIVVFPDHTHFLFYTGRYCITPIAGISIGAYTCKKSCVIKDVMIVSKPHAYLYVQTINKRLTKFQKDRYTVR